MFRYILVSLLIFQVFASNSTPTSGPYKSTILGIKDCDEPPRPYIKNSAFIFETSITNTTKGRIVAGKTIILRDTKNLKIKLKSFLIHNGTMDLISFINRLDCHGMLVNLVIAASKINYDKKTCTYFKGTYTYKNFDTNQIYHMWKETMEYGRLLWRIEATVPAGTMFCREFDTLVEPI